MDKFMESRPQVFTASYAEGVEKVRKSEGKYAFFLESASNDYFNMREPCDTIRVGEPINSRGYGVATHMNSSFRQHLNLAVLHLQEDGTLDELRRLWWQDKSECLTDDHENVINFL